MKTNPHELLFHALTAWRSIRLLAYIDPGSGSYCYQMLIAGLTGVIFFFSTIKRKVLSLFNKAEPNRDLPGPLPSKDLHAGDSRDKGVAQKG